MPSQGERKTVSDRKIDFKIFRFLDLENFQKFFKILVKILNFLNIFLQKVAIFSPFS